jgi:hypothetical protein
MAPAGRIVATIPVKNEEAHIGMCLDALSAQSRPCGIKLLGDVTSLRTQMQEDALRLDQIAEFPHEIFLAAKHKVIYSNITKDTGRQKFRPRAGRCCRPVATSGAARRGQPPMARLYEAHITDIFITAATPHLIPLRQTRQTKFRMDLFYRNPNSFL